MLWPGVAKLSCADCQRFNYKIPEGTLQTYETDEGYLPVLREEGMPPPCDQCPRKGPQNEQRLKLSDRNWLAYRLYRRLEATRGAYQLDPIIASCSIFADNMRIIRDTIAEVKQGVIERARSEAEERARPS